MSITQVEQRTIGGRQYDIRVLNVMEGRKVYQRIQKLLAVVGDQELAASGLDPIMVAGMSGVLQDGDIEFLCDKFAPQCTVSLPGDRVLVMSAKGVMDEVFAGNFEEMFEWIAACIEVNFKGLIEKMRGALQKVSDKAREPQLKD